MPAAELIAYGFVAPFAEVGVPFAYSEREQRVRTALGELPEEQVRVVQLSFFEGRAHGDIARLLDLPLGTVKSHIHRGRAQLKQVFAERECET